MTNTISQSSTQQATFAAGCFWGVQEEFAKVPGVLTTQVGYTGGTTKNPTYEQVCNTDTQHAEAVNITFDEKVISYEKLLEIFWDMHDPTTIDRQGPDVGSQYRSAIFTHNALQEKLAKKALKNREAIIKQKIVTQIVPAGEFYRAEEYHQHYIQKRNKKRFGFF